MAAKKLIGTAVVKWDEELARRAKAARKVEASVSVGSFISCRGGQMTFNGNPVPGNKVRAVVLSSIPHNTYYTGKFDPKKPQSPVCYSFGYEEAEMSPHEESAEPQHATCQGCPHNQWGSADVGRGKACKNIRRLALLAEDALSDGPDGVAQAQVAYLHVPVTSVRAWASYVNNLEATTNKPPLAFVTEVSVVPDENDQFKVLFRCVEAVEDGALIGALLARADAVDKEIAFSYQALEEPAPVSKGRTTAGRAGVATSTGKGKTAAGRQSSVPGSGVGSATGRAPRKF